MYRYLEKTDRSLFDRIILAESVVDWMADGHYDNLLDLEKDIAGLTSSIILFLESPGSIAELGSFIQINDIAEKMIVVVRHDHVNGENGRSFISLGPIRMLEKRHRDKKLVYPWGVRKIKGGEKVDPQVIGEFADDIVDEIRRSFIRHQRGKKFSPQLAEHKVLFLSDMVYVSEVCRLTDIRDAFEAVSMKIDDNEIRKYLSIAKGMKLIYDFEYGREKFYFPRYSGNNLVFSFKRDLPYSKKDMMKWVFTLRIWNRRRRFKYVKAMKASGFFPGLQV